MSQPETPKSSAEYFREKIRRGEEVIPPKTPEDGIIPDVFEKQGKPPSDLQNFTMAVEEDHYDLEELDTPNTAEKEEMKKLNSLYSGLKNENIDHTEATKTGRMVELFQTPMPDESPTPWVETPLVAKEYFGYSEGGKERLKTEEESEEKRLLNSLMDNLAPKENENFLLNSKSISYFASKLVNDVINKTVKKMTSKNNYKQVSSDLVHSIVENSIQKCSIKQNVSLIDFFKNDSTLNNLLISTTDDEIEECIQYLAEALEGRGNGQKKKLVPSEIKKIAGNMMHGIMNQVLIEFE
eukprot:gene12274-5858_t